MPDKMICMTLYPLFFSVKCVVLIWCVSLCDLAHVISMLLYVYQGNYIHTIGSVTTMSCECRLHIACIDILSCNMYSVNLKNFY